MKRKGFLFLLFWVWVQFATAGDGSNLGDQATHFEPPILTGSITHGVDPAAGARLNTVSGQHAVSDQNGNYQAVLDAPGIYRVSAGAALNRREKTVEVFFGQTTILDFDLGTPCPVIAWPELDTILVMVSCMNSNQSPSND